MRCPSPVTLGIFVILLFLNLIFCESMALYVKSRGPKFSILVPKVEYALFQVFLDRFQDKSKPTVYVFCNKYVCIPHIMYRVARLSSLLFVIFIID